MRIQPRVIVYRSLITDWFAHSVEFDIAEPGADAIEALQNLSVAVEKRLLEFANAERYNLRFELFRQVDPYIMYLFAAGDDQETNWELASSDLVKFDKPMVRMVEERQIIGDLIRDGMEV